MTANLTIVSLQSETTFFNAYPFLKVKLIAIENIEWQKFFLQWFHLIENNLPFAALGAVALDWQSNANWLRADPVYLQSDLNQVYLHTVDLSETEQLKIQQVLFPYLQQENLVLKINNNEWYLQLNQPPKIQTTPVYDVLNKNIYNYLPQGEGAATWRRWLTEMQMILTDAAIGQVNGLWLWGEGHLPVGKLISKFDFIYTDINWLKGLAQLATVELVPDIMLNKFAGNYLLMLDNKNSEQEILNFLIPKLQRKFDKIEIILLDGRYEAQVKPWWRKFIGK